jgi:hypothetical protein
MRKLEEIAASEEVKAQEDKSLARKAYDFGKQYIDYKMGGAGAAVLGGLVWYINSEHGFWPATTASLKQAAYTFLFGGFVVKTCESLATKIQNDKAAKALAVIIPSALAIGATYLFHTIKGTPEPLNSTIPTMLLSPPSFIYWSHRKRKQHTQNHSTKYISSS